MSNILSKNNAANGAILFMETGFNASKIAKTFVEQGKNGGKRM